MNLHAIPCFIIHRVQDVIREPSILELETKLGLPLQRFEGLSGDFLIESGFPRKHPHEGLSNAGIIGCAASHIELLEAAIASTSSHYCIFEDDAELVGNLPAYFSSLEGLPEADLVCMGVNEIVDGTATTVSSIKKVTRFWGTHAMIVNRKTMTAVLATYKKYVSLGYALPADWLYSYAIKEHGLLAYAPVKSVIRQRPGFVSVITGIVRR